MAIGHAQAHVVAGRHIRIQALVGGEQRRLLADQALTGGGVGDAFIWDNVVPTGAVDPLTLHAGRPPTQGMKYLLSKWMRDRSQVGNDS